jgi:hypothetical protein
MSRITVKLTVVFASALLLGCATTRSLYYDTWEKFGYAKRERLADNVKAARDEQAKAKEQFASALDQFKSVVNFQGGDLEAMFNKLNKAYERSASQADAVRSKVAAVKNVGNALFEEWSDEIKRIKDDPSLQRQSQALYDKTKQNYGEMIARMDSASAAMDPVLTRFNNRVLFVKHNLNAQAIASLRGTEVEMGGEIDRLIKEMEASIAEADQFIAQIRPPTNG